MKRTKKEAGRRNPMHEAMDKRYRNTETTMRHRCARRAKDAGRIRKEFEY
jgi:hypothetical protein